jgi:hypothetical protein
MPKSVRATLLIIAAVLGVILLYIPVEAFVDGAFSTSLRPTFEKIGWLLLIPTAILGVLAALPLGKENLSRIFAAGAAGIATLSILLPIAYYLVSNIRFDVATDEALGLAWSDFKYLLGLWPVEDYYPTWNKLVYVIRVIAIILWIICAAFPAKKVSAGMHGAHAAEMPNSFPNNAFPANPMPSSYPAPMSPSPVTPPASQGAKFCTNCGKPLVGVAKFCAECGTPT